MFRFRKSNHGRTTLRCLCERRAKEKDEHKSSLLTYSECIDSNKGIIYESTVYKLVH